MRLCMKMQGFIYAMYKLGFASREEVDPKYLYSRERAFEGTTAEWSGWEV